MAGYVFNLSGGFESVRACCETGVYATFLSDPSGRWLQHHEATFGDYASMRESDYVFFFAQRNIYGVGRLITLGNACTYKNFPEATSHVYPIAKGAVSAPLLWDNGDEPTRQRWLCVFEPSPFFFSQGVDMDDVLTYRQSSFRMLRAMAGRSFVKLDDEESQALREVILRVNRRSLPTPTPAEVIPFSKAVHEGILDKTSPSYELRAGELMALCSQGTTLTHEMALEAGTVWQLTRGIGTEEVFGPWDFVAHQVTASPPKPPAYIDFMDVFGYAHLPNHAPIPSQFKVIEAKRGRATPDDVAQAMKYVDWIKDEYCFGDYSQVSAFLLARSFSDAALASWISDGNRLYTVGRRPAVTRRWNDLTLVEYTYDAASTSLAFKRISKPKLDQ